MLDLTLLTHCVFFNFWPIFDKNGWTYLVIFFNIWPKIDKNAGLPLVVFSSQYFAPCRVFTLSIFYLKLIKILDLPHVIIFSLNILPIIEVLQQLKNTDTIIAIKYTQRAHVIEQDWFIIQYKYKGYWQIAQYIKYTYF